MKKAGEITKSSMDIQKQKLEIAKKLKITTNSAECYRKKQRIFLRSIVELEQKLQEAQEKLNQATVTGYA